MMAAPVTRLEWANLELAGHVGAGGNAGDRRFVDLGGQAGQFGGERWLAGAAGRAAVQEVKQQQESRPVSGEP